MSKVCPLFFAGTAGMEEFECRPDRCAWAYDGGCAITVLARALDGLNESGIITWPEEVNR